MKSIISGAVIMSAIAVSLTLNVQAKPINHPGLTAKAMAVSDTGKMAKMDKMDKMKKKKMDKMSKKKMSKDTSGKM